MKVFFQIISKSEFFCEILSTQHKMSKQVNYDMKKKINCDFTISLFCYYCNQFNLKMIMIFVLFELSEKKEINIFKKKKVLDFFLGGREFCIENF